MRFTRNLAAWTPDSADLARAREAFAALGFRVGTGSGSTFSIAAAADVFEARFGVRLRAGREGTYTAARGSSLDQTPVSA
jgi:hypothetical protein